MLFIELEYTIATEEAERIGVDHIAKYSNNNTMVESTVAEHLNAQYSAINLLNNRINVMFEYVKCVKQNKLSKNNEILREIRSLCHRLPIIKNEKFYKQYYMVSISSNLVNLKLSMKVSPFSFQAIQRHTLDSVFRHANAVF